MKSWRRGFIWWRSLEGLCGDHDVEARLSNWEIPVGLAEERECEAEGNGDGAEVEYWRC